MTFREKKIKRIKYLLTIFYLFFPYILFCSPLEVNINASSYLLMNMDSGAILVEKDGYKQTYPASVTKIATAIYTIERGGASFENLVTADAESLRMVEEEAKVKSRYTLSPYWIDTDGTIIGLRVGEKMSLLDLLYGLMVCSGNDAANVIAKHIGGTIKGFTKSLNSYLDELGCHSTHFKNPSGLHHPEHITTAYDLAVLTRHALKNSLFREIVSTVRWTRPETEFQAEVTLIQGNRLLKKGSLHYPKAIGVKHGITSAAKHTLVAAATHQGRTLIAVLLGNPDVEQMYRDARKLFEAAFKEKPVDRVVLKKGKQDFYKSFPDALWPLQATIEDTVTINYYPAEEPSLEAEVIWDELELPIEKGQRVGVIHLRSQNNGENREVIAYASEKIKSSSFAKLLTLFKTRKNLDGMLIGALFACSLIYVFRSKRRTRR